MAEIPGKEKRAESSKSLHKAIFRPYSDIRVAGKPNIIRPSRKSARSAKVRLEHYAVRMLALASAVSLETTLNALKANGRSEEMLRVLGEYEQLRLSGAVPEAVREQLANGEWHQTQRGEFHPIRYNAQRAAVPGEISLTNEFGEQSLKFRLQVALVLAATGDPSNIPLLRAEPPLQVQPPDTKAVMPGALVHHIDLTEVSGTTAGKPVDLTNHRATGLAVGS
jgi:hypothetical protein